MGKKTALLILDGWGHGSNEKSNAIYCANTPFVDSLYDKYPNTELANVASLILYPCCKIFNGVQSLHWLWHMHR